MKFLCCGYENTTILVLPRAPYIIDEFISFFIHPSTVRHFYFCSTPTYQVVQVLRRLCILNNNNIGICIRYILKYHNTLNNFEIKLSALRSVCTSDQNSETTRPDVDTYMIT